MESNNIERAPEVELKEIPISDEETLKQIAALITEHSWFEGYPMDPMDEIKAAEHIVGAYAGKDLAGFGSINRVASPDGLDNGEWWFADAVVLPAYRNRGIYTKLYEERMHWLDGKEGRILSCTENPIIDDFFVAHGWHKLRDTKDEQGNDCRVYEYSRSTESSDVSPGFDEYSALVGRGEYTAETEASLRTLLEKYEEDLYMLYLNYKESGLVDELPGHERRMYEWLAKEFATE